jgi:3-deoxy-D-manno-octulosonate cytidylyltransferase
VINLKDIVYTNGKFVTNVAILMINYLILKDFKEVDIVGLDGYQEGKNNYAYDETSIIIDVDLFNELNQVVKDALYSQDRFINIELCTPSVYAESIPLKVMGVIPARFDSSRFQGKPLSLINNVPMIKRTYERAQKSKLLDKLVVATDSQKIKDYCDLENIPVVMTSKKHLTGTDRLAEVAGKEVFDFYINIQGDEPVIDYQAIDQVVNDYKENKNKYDIFNLYKKIDNLTEVESKTIIKTVVDVNDNLMYMSRQPIPFDQSTNGATYHKQVCVYGYTKEALNVFSKREKTHNEQFEDIEVLRFLDLGYKVKMSETTFDSIAVDIPNDVKKVEDFLIKNHLP